MEVSHAVSVLSVVLLSKRLTLHANSTNWPKQMQASNGVKLPPRKVVEACQQQQNQLQSLYECVYSIISELYTPVTINESLKMIYEQVLRVDRTLKMIKQLMNIKCINKERLRARERRTARSRFIVL